MATTPPEKKAPPPATPGFAAALFGGLFSTAKKQRLVDSSTVPMASVARTTRVHHRPEIYLESENESTSIDKVVTTSAIDLLDTDVPSASPEPQMERSTSFPVKSPWKSPSLHAMNGSKTSSLRFSVGNVKAPPSERRSSLSQKSQITNRRRYTPSALLVPSRRGKTGPINAVNAVNALQNSQNLFQLSSKQAEARNNHISFRVGKRLLGSSQSGGSRLAQAVDMEERSPSSEERAVKRRKHVMFGDAVDATPIESEVVTPTRTPGQKRKGTPFKATISEVDTTPHHAEAPTPSRKPSIGPRPQTKILLEKGNYNFEESGETKPLGSPVASRTPLFMQSPSMTLQLPLDHAPRTAAKRFKDQAATPSVKETSKPAAIDTFRPGGAAKTRAATFKCHECQAETSIEQSKCSKCGAARQVVTSGWGDLFADQKKRWKCAVCSVQNEQSATECAACETPRDGKESTAPSSSKDAPVSKASIGTSGFSFGGGSAVPATSTGGFTFGSQSAPPKSLPSKEAGFSLASATSSSSKGQGFTFGAAPTSTTTGTSFTFGTSTTSATSGTASSGGGFKFDTPAPGGSSGGGFSFSSFPASATEKEKSRTSTGNGTSASTLVPASPSAPSSNESSSKSLAENETKTPSFKFGSTASSKAETENHKPAGFSFASSAQATGEGNGVAKPFQFNASSDEKKSEDALTVKPNFSFHSSSSSSPKKPQLPIPGTEPADKARPANGSSFTIPIANINKSVPSKVLADSQPQLTAVSSVQPQSQTSTPQPKPSSSATPFGASSLSGTQSSFGFGGTNSTSSLAFGSPSAFGSGSALGLTFGQGTAFSFGSSAFGVTSTLGGTPTTSTQPLTQASPSGPTFGATTFGSASLSTTPSVGFGALAASQGTGIFASNQFNAFEKPNAASPMIGMPVKPLFGSNTPSKVETKEGLPPTTPSTVMETKAKENPIRPVTPHDSSPGSTNAEASTTIKMPNIGSLSVEKPSSLPVRTPLTADGEKAMKVFENMDTAKSGFLPADKFEDLSNQLGEGFHGEELDAQLRRLDPSGSGKISRADFVRWYDDLTQGNQDNDDDDDDDNDEGSLDSDEMAERAEEEQKARKCFGDLSTTDSDGQRFILVSSMEKLIINLLRKLKKPGDMIYESDFVSWYMECLFGGEDGSDFEDEDDDDGADGDRANRKGATAAQEDLGSMFKVDKDSRKCAVCSVRNGGDKKKCAACETVRVGFENDPDVTASSSISTGGSAIGSSGFTFGVSFGAAPAPFGSVAGSFGVATPGQQSFRIGGPGRFVSPAGGFGNQGGFSQPGAEAVQFRIGTGGSSKSAMRGRRPLLRAQRPTSVR